MTETSSPILCKFSCSPTDASNPDCGCAGAKVRRKMKIAKYFAGFITFCAVCCAIPAALVSLGLISLATGAYLGNGLGAVLIILTVLGLGFILMQYVKKR